MSTVFTLLDFTRIEAGRGEARYIATDLAAFTADLASTFRSLVEKAGLAFEVHCETLPEPVYVDHDMWEKIVLNLLSNAFKFTFAGSISVELHALDGSAELVVRDTGTGVPAEEVPRLFERFHRVEGARARTHEGSGIGLSLVQELVHLHGGTITLASTEGVGTTVRVCIPFGSQHLPAERINAPSHLSSTALGAEVFVEEAQRWMGAGDAQPVAVPTGMATSDLPLVRAHAGAHIVVVNDNADMRDYLARILGAHYQVETLANGALALAAIRADPPALVVTDVMMPKLDGFGLLAAMRADPATASVPVIMLSARAGEEATIEGLQAGADDYLVKPFSSRELLARVSAHLEMARLRREALARVRELEATFATMADGVVIYDATGNLVEWNAAVADLFEFDRMPHYFALSREQETAFLQARNSHGDPLPTADLPMMRALRGEVLTGEHTVDLALTLPRSAMRLAPLWAPLSVIVISLNANGWKSKRANPWQRC